MNYTAAVITISDKGARGEHTDTSGPALCQGLKRSGWKVVYTAIIPDEGDQIQKELIKCADEMAVNLVLTTGGTGFSPRDVTPEATLAVIQRETPGIPEAMRAASMKITPRGCLSRSAAGIRGRTLIVNLPGSEKAARENLFAVVDALRHGVEMLLSDSSADHAASPFPRTPPSMDEWLREAKAAPVRGMLFSYNREKADAAVADTYRMDGIYYVKAWLNDGQLQVGDDIMYVLIGGGTRPHAVEVLQYLVDQLKNECVEETELC